jgi:soluble lytic murein transglycosylase-like protein
MILVVMEVERGRVGLESGNRDGSKDYGPMQINSLWLPRLREHGIGEGLLRDHGCVNVAVGAWLLRWHLERTGDPLKAIAGYHSRSEGRGGRYLREALGRARGLRVRDTLARANGEGARRPRAGRR